MDGIPLSGCFLHVVQLSLMLKMTCPRQPPVGQLSLMLKMTCGPVVVGLYREVAAVQRSMDSNVSYCYLGPGRLAVLEWWLHYDDPYSIDMEVVALYSVCYRD